MFICLMYAYIRISMYTYVEAAEVFSGTGEYMKKLKMIAPKVPSCCG